MTAPPERSGALRRILLAGVAYGALALVVGLPVIAAMRRVFLLPPVFVPLARGLLVVVGAVVLLAAWRYPHMGEERPPSDTGDPPAG